MRGVAEAPVMVGRRRLLPMINLEARRGESREGLDPMIFVTHRFALADTISAYDTFADAAATHALKVVFEGGARDASSNGHIAAGLVAGSA